MNARAVFNRSEAVLEYRPTPTLDGSYSWYWILLSAQDTCLGSGTAPNRAKASVQARLKARQLGRHISKVRIAGSQQEGLQRAKDFIMQQTPRLATPCGEPCSLCGKPCTLVHRGTGRDSLVTGEHICPACDAAWVYENPGQVKI